MKENAFNDLLRRNLHKDGHWTRVENIAGVGIPDINWCYKGKDIWIESKMVRGQRITFEASQITWTKNRVKYGGDNWVLARKENNIYLARASVIHESIQWLNKPFVSLADFIQYGDSVYKKPFKWEILKNKLVSI